MNFTMRERKHHNAGMRGLRGGLTFSEQEKEQMDPDANYWKLAFRTAEKQLWRALSEDQWAIWVQAWDAADPNTKTYRECYEAVSQAKALAETGEQVATIIEEILGGGS
jgi:hypothetical protein